MNIQVAPFGEISKRPVKTFTLQNRSGVSVKLCSYGAMITELYTPDRFGNNSGPRANIVTGFGDLDTYLNTKAYFGCTVGRVANRIANGKFSLDGKSYTLAVNNGPNCLHGGLRGFDKQIWDAEVVEGGANQAVQFSYLSPDMEEGFPGNLKASVTFTLADSNELRIDYLATCDQATPINLTNHAYFNLKGAGNGDILDHTLSINADAYTPVDSTLIPTGEIRSVQGTPLDFRTPAAVGSRLQLVQPGYDHNYVLNKNSTKPAARLSEKTTGRTLEVYTTQPGVQLYTGNFLDGSIQGNGGRYNRHGALCLETQHFPDSINRSNFPSCVLRPGETYRHTTRFVFGVES